VYDRSKARDPNQFGERQMAASALIVTPKSGQQNANRETQSTSVAPTLRAVFFKPLIGSSGDLGNVSASSGELRDELNVKRPKPLLVFATVNERIVS